MARRLRIGLAALATLSLWTRNTGIAEARDSCIPPPIEAEPSSGLHVDICLGLCSPDNVVLDLAGPNAGEIAHVIVNDLNGSGLFRVLDEAPESQADETRLVADRRAKAPVALLVGSVEHSDDDRLSVSFRVLDFETRAQLAATNVETLTDDWRSTAHQLADCSLEALTSDQGYFDSRIVFVSEESIGSRLAMMDQDGANLSYLTDGRQRISAPALSPDQDMMLYESDEAGQRRVHLLDLASGESRLLFPDADRATHSAVFSPSGETVAFVRDTSNGSEVQLLSLSTGTVEHLSESPTIDDEPSFSPDGNWIAFSSERTGSSELYLMQRDGSDVQRISFGSGDYYGPAWSPRGDLLAFVKEDGDQAYLGAMRPDGSGERLLSGNVALMRPSWAPNGRMLIFTSRSDGRHELRTILLTGFNERVSPTPGAASWGAWSRLQQ